MTGYRLFSERSKHLRQPRRTPFEFLSAAVHVLRRCQHQRRAVCPRLALRPRGDSGNPRAVAMPTSPRTYTDRAAAGEAISTTATLASSASSSGPWPMSSSSSHALPRRSSLRWSPDLAVVQLF